jgi:hypothetical protein
MCSDLLSDTRLYGLLLKFDEDLFAQTRAEGCPCGGVLHRRAGVGVGRHR